MRTLADFLNHGTLPFVGREAETARIVDFWRGTFEATELRAMLIVGEAGIGKSRLLENAMRSVVDAGGSLVHVKLYPESTASFMSMVARALWHPFAARAILTEEPEAKIGAIGNAMQRLARLRPTLVVLEDLHLLGDDALPELARLLQVLADETISLLALARPVDLPARGVLEPYLIEELALGALTREDCARIWCEVSGVEDGPALGAALLDATAGNPLALRSALRGVLRSDDTTGSATRAAHSTASLARALKRTVGLLADGMTAHLSREELQAAKRLASLGEIFSREAAHLMLDDAGTLVATLLFKGVIATPIAPPDALPAEPSAHPPLGFTHTLLHRQLIENAAIDTERLVRVIADAPLYSILPFRLLAGRACNTSSLDTATVARAFDRTFKVQIAIRQSAQWRRTEETWAMAVRLVESRIGSWEREDWERMIVKLINHKLDLVRHERAGVRERWLGHLTSLTTAADTDELAKGRFVTLFYQELLFAPNNPDVTRELWIEAEALVARRPHLRLTFPYADYVIAACVGAYSNGDTEMMRRIEHCADTLLASNELPAQIRRTFERKVRPPLLKLFESESELAAKLAQVAEFEGTVEKNDISVWMFCIDLLADVGLVDRLRGVAATAIPLMREQGMMAPYVDAVVKLHCVLAGLADSLEPAIAAFEGALAEAPARRRDDIRFVVGKRLLDAALLRGELGWVREAMDTFGITEPDLAPVQWMLLALGSDDPRAALADARARGCREDGHTALLDAVLDDGSSVDTAGLGAMLRAPVLRVADVLRTHAAVATIGRIRETRPNEPLAPALESDAADAVMRSLAWLAAEDRGLFAFMRPLFERGGSYLSGRQKSAWQKRIDELAHVRQKEQEIAGGGRMRFSMLGAITAHMPDGRQQRFQGARARMLLAMMVINQVLDEPLSSAEFCRLAAGGQDIDIENARDVVKTTVHRLREVIGRDAVLTDGSTPRLNPDLVDVDLLEAHMLLKRASEAIRRSSPMQAKGALMSALEITRGEVPFPSLYDDMIEAVREDFENAIRTTVIDVAAALAREGGWADAADVLRSACNAIPGDEELAELLRDALLQSGRRAEAERARMKSEVV